jgi:hypothetical protein
MVNKITAAIMAKRIKEKDTAEGKTVDKRTTAVRDIYRYEKGVLTK